MPAGATPAKVGKIAQNLRHVSRGDTMHAEPFDIAIPDHALDDLRRRLRAARRCSRPPSRGSRVWTARGWAN